MPCWKHEERQARLRFLCQVPSNLKLSHFHRRPLCSANCLCGGAECASAEGVWLAECAARTAKQPQGPAPAYVPVSGLLWFLSFRVVFDDVVNHTAMTKSPYWGN